MEACHNVRKKKKIRNLENKFHELASLLVSLLFKPEQISHEYQYIVITVNNVQIFEFILLD